MWWTDMSLRLTEPSHGLHLKYMILISKFSRLKMKIHFYISVPNKLRRGQWCSIEHYLCPWGERLSWFIIHYNFQLNHVHFILFVYLDKLLILYLLKFMIGIMCSLLKHQYKLSLKLTNRNLDDTLSTHTLNFVQNSRIQIRSVVYDVIDH